ncbi:MAG: hypothetical protein DYG98_04860 [Haliscomenobacteraceae bacterium CHB4]|nr:hypothetical protein [Haliscomenobacteraceae bacterium CHB4]
MKKMMLAAALLFAAAHLIYAQNPGTDTGDRIAERVEAQETESSDQEALVKEIADAARKAGKGNPKDADKVKEAVRKKLDEIRDRKSENGKPGGKDNKEVKEWIKQLKRDLMDNAYVSLPQLGDTPLLCSASGTGRTTGQIAILTLRNPTNQEITVDVGPFFIPSGGQYQPYIVPNIGSVSVLPHATANVPLEGYCADIFTKPVPAGNEMPPVNEWVNLSGSHALPSTWAPNPANGWKPAPGSSVLMPGTGRPLGYTLDVKRHAAEAAPLLLDALNRIAETYDELNNEGTITTPFSGNPEKERESVIQQTFWIYAAELTGKAYKKDDFKANTVRQFEEATGQDFEKTDEKTRSGLNAGVDQFWNTFEAVGAEAKVLKG